MNKQLHQDIMNYVNKNKSNKFVPAGQSTQMIIGATSENDLDIMTKSSKMYENLFISTSLAPGIALA